MTTDWPEYRRSAFYWSLRRHMEAWPGFAGGRTPMWDRWQDGIYQDYRGLAEETVKDDSVELHPYVAHILSSQVFTFNMFLPFRNGLKAGLTRKVSGLVGEEVTIDRVGFEWVPPGHLLGEIDGERPLPGEAATAVDCVLWCWLANGNRAAVLVEVKLTEAAFSHCNGRTSPNNRRKDVCQSAQLFLDDPQDCYLTHPAGKIRDRRYWEIFAGSAGSLRDAFPNVELNGECPFAYDMQQPMRNLAIAQGLVQEGTVEKAWYMLCGHDHNQDIAEHWQAWRQLVNDATPAPFLPASEVVKVGEEDGLLDWGKYMRARYRL